MFKQFTKLVVIAALLQATAQATVLVTPSFNNTNCAAVTLTSVSNGSGNLLQQNYNASQCIGFVPNSYQYQEGQYQYDLNIGTFGDGLLNGEAIEQNLPKKPGDSGKPAKDDVRYFNGTEFTGTAADPFAGWVADKNGVLQPGWIGLAMQNLGGTADYNDVAGFNLAQVLSLGFSAAADGKSGTWSLAVDAAAIEKAAALLGKAYFDHLAIVLKAGSDLVVYDFNFKNIFDQHNSQYGTNLSLYSNYTLAGRWNSGTDLNKQLSHIVMAAHDPQLTDPVTVPAPAPVALLGLGLIALFLRKRNA